MDWSELALRNDKFLRHLNIWVFGVGTKLVPCVLLTYLSLALIRVLIEADERKKRLHGTKVPPSSAMRRPTKELCSPQEASSYRRPSDCGTVLPSLLANTPNTITNTTTTTATSNSLLTSTPKRMPIESKYDNPTGYDNKTETPGKRAKTNNLKKNPFKESQPLLCQPSKKPDNSLSVQNKKPTNSQPSSVPIDQNNNSQEMTAHRPDRPTKSPPVSNSMTINGCPVPQREKRQSTGSMSRQSILIIKSRKETMCPGSKYSGERTTGGGNCSYTSDRTTKMLLSVLLIFLITEFPSGILVLLSSIFGNYNNFLLKKAHAINEILRLIILFSAFLST